MFRSSLKTSLENIFGLKRVSFDTPGDTKEQEVLFVEIKNNVSRVTNGRAIAKATGTLSVYANQEKLPFGYFHKKINSANIEDTCNFFFHGFDSNEKYFGNLIERSLNFVYFYNSEYNPNSGLITSLETNEV
jgi:hypothetical protein